MTGIPVDDFFPAQRATTGTPTTSDITKYGYYSYFRTIKHIHIVHSKREEGDETSTLMSSVI